MVKIDDHGTPILICELYANDEPMPFISDKGRLKN